MQQLFLMRHAQSVANATQIIAGSHESPLSAVGERQAAIAGQTIKQYFSPIDLIICSPQDRAVQTAQIVAQQCGYPAHNIVPLQDLRERDLGAVEGQDYQHSQQHNGNYEDIDNVPGSESLQHLYDRAEKVLDWIKNRPEQRILIVCHNGCGRMLKAAYRGEQPKNMYDQPRLENAIIYPLN